VLAGCGGISRTWLKSLPPDGAVEIVGLADIRREAAERLVAEAGLAAPAFAGIEEALRAVRPDAVFDCTTPEAHHPTTLAALRAGCHVLVEKPLADTLPRARELVAEAARAGRILAVTQTRRYDPNLRRVRALLASGALGRIGTVDVDFQVGAHFGGFRDRMAHVLLLDMAIHTFDQARCLSGLDPVSVFCREFNPPGSWYDRDAAAVAVFEMTGGAVFTYRGSWCAEGLNTSWEGAWRIGCERGAIRWDGGADLRAQRVAKTGGFRSEWEDVPIPPNPEPAKVGGHAGVIAEFVRCVTDGSVPETNAADNLKSLAMSLSAVESATTGRPVPVSG
jgi:predicted dehydrogenase